MDPHEVLLTAGRCALLYLSLLCSLRVAAARPVRSFTPLDLIALVALSELAARPITGQFPLPQALFLIAALSALHYGVAQLSGLSPELQGLLRGTPRIVVRHGEVCTGALKAACLSERDLRALLRGQQIERLDEVKLATLELSGQLSVVRTERARPVQKGDLQEMLGRVGRPRREVVL